MLRFGCCTLLYKARGKTVCLYISQVAHQAAVAILLWYAKTVETPARMVMIVLQGHTLLTCQVFFFIQVSTASSSFLSAEGTSQLCFLVAPCGGRFPCSPAPLSMLLALQLLQSIVELRKGAA